MAATDFVLFPQVLLPCPCHQSPRLDSRRHLAAAKVVAQELSSHNDVTSRSARRGRSCLEFHLLHTTAVVVDKITASPDSLMLISSSKSSQNAKSKISKCMPSSKPL